MGRCANDEFMNVNMRAKIMWINGYQGGVDNATLCLFFWPRQNCQASSDQRGESGCQRRQGVRMNISSRQINYAQIICALEVGNLLTTPQGKDTKMWCGCSKMKAALQRHWPPSKNEKRSMKIQSQRPRNRRRRKNISLQNLGVL
jgi:hypothetical protein